jgi:hypothetical protein
LKEKLDSSLVVFGMRFKGLNVSFSFHSIQLKLSDQQEDTPPEFQELYGKQSAIILPLAAKSASSGCHWALIWFSHLACCCVIRSAYYAA